jgi:hypothetical protein
MPGDGNRRAPLAGTDAHGARGAAAILRAAHRGGRASISVLTTPALRGSRAVEPPELCNENGGPAWPFLERWLAETCESL